MSIIELLNKESTWNEFLQYKIDGGHITKQEQEKLTKYSTNKEYIPVIDKIISREDFAIPTMKHINKKNSTKKRTVFLFNDKENYIGYATDLNKVKGLSVEDADVLLFDEFVELKRSDYKGGSGGINEPNILARLDETLFRNRENWHIYLGNEDQPTDPYTENFRIPYKAMKYKNKERGLFYEFDISKATIDFKKTTSTGQRWKGTEYEQYSNGEKALNTIDEDFICDKPKHAKLFYNIKVAGQRLTLWRDENTGINYIHDDCNFNANLPIMSVMDTDMCINSEFISYNSQFLQWVKFMFSHGFIRYNNQKSYSLFSIVIGLTK